MSEIVASYFGPRNALRTTRMTPANVLPLCATSGSDGAAPRVEACRVMLSTPANDNDPSLFDTIALRQLRAWGMFCDHAHMDEEGDAIRRVVELIAGRPAVLSEPHPTGRTRPPRLGVE